MVAFLATAATSLRFASLPSPPGRERGEACQHQEGRHWRERRERLTAVGEVTTFVRLDLSPLESMWM
ncbi:hypothetical protein E2562_009475 [Oryza meyeriana var. granulata]|uniref:Uncharacterized protein n=1 Tax=Oryza meyeriana var. granulata TaxID=110450 RepID=A0A6G1BTI2_9ORYZ|nr:hypothetical protein E2562_009475 [Oryza meyeriana var. granulata]